MRSSWDTVWAEVAQAVARRSACDRAQVGAVLVLGNRVLATGYNGPAPGYPADTSQGCTSWCERARSNPSLATPYGYACPAVHAEPNALLYTARAEGATLYTTHAPCADCTKLITAAGVARLVILRPQDAHRPDAVPYLLACGVVVEFL